jgi:hypothetical protein
MYNAELRVFSLWKTRATLWIACSTTWLPVRTDTEHELSSNENSFRLLTHCAAVPDTARHRMHTCNTQNKECLNITSKTIHVRPIWERQHYFRVRNLKADTGRDVHVQVNITPTQNQRRLLHYAQKSKASSTLCIGNYSKLFSEGKGFSGQNSYYKCVRYFCRKTTREETDRETQSYMGEYSNRSSRNRVWQSGPVPSGSVQGSVVGPTR